MRPFLFRCPVTGLLVQGTPPTQDETQYVVQTCQACGRLHLVNPLTGKLMSEEHVRPNRP